ncbi:hypothetical protein SDC9_140148 [bioreactor metagenome]|uniref:Uncharacterized protein n=1 Tax=bioreactor metagenome TaxID=1076179 RepID=A0A645DXF6_9ZZZZ
MPFFRNKSAVLGQLLRCNELFNFIDGDRQVDLAAHVSVFTAAVADAPADGREGVFDLDELQRFAIFSLRRKLEITLHGDMRRAVGLARRGAAVHHVLAVEPVFRVPFILGPLLVARGNGCRDVRNHRCLGAELLTEFERVDRAVFHALSAGDALRCIHFGDVVGAHHVYVLKHCCGAHREAAAAATVADCVGLAAAVGVGDFVHQSVFFRALEDFICFRARDLAPAPGADVILSRKAHLDAHVFLEVPTAFAHDLAVRAAAARRNGEDIVLLQIGRDFLIARAV